MFKEFYYDPSKLGYLSPERPLLYKRQEDGYHEVVYPIFNGKTEFIYLTGGENNVPDLYHNRTKAIPYPYDFLIGDIIKSHLVESVATMQNKGFEYYNAYRTMGNRRRIIDYLWNHNVELSRRGEKYLNYRDIEAVANQIIIIAPHVVDYIKVKPIPINPDIYLTDNEVYDTVEPMFEFVNNIEDVDYIKDAKNEFKNIEELSLEELLTHINNKLDDEMSWFINTRVKVQKEVMLQVRRIIEELNKKENEREIQDYFKTKKSELEEKYKRKTLQSINHDFNSSKVVFVSPMALKADNFYNQINQYFPEVSPHGGSTVKYYYTGRGKEIWRMKGCNAPYLIDYCDIIRRTPLIQNLILGENCKLTPTEKEKALSGVFIIELDRSLKLRKGSPISESIIEYYLHTPNVYTNHPCTRDNVTQDMVTDRTNGWYSIIQNELYKITFIPEHLITTKPYFVANTGDLIGMCKLNHNIVHPNSIQYNSVQSNFTNLIGNTTHYVLNSHNPNVELYRIEHKSIKTINSIYDVNLPEGLTIIDTYNDTVLEEKFININDVVALEYVGVYTRRDEAEYVLRNLSLKYEELNLKFKEIDYKEKELYANREISEINKDIQKSKLGLEKSRMTHEKIIGTMKLTGAALDTATKIGTKLITK